MSRLKGWKKRERRERRMAGKCPRGCDGLTRVEQQWFKNGTVHLRLVCSVCERYIRFVSPTDPLLADLSEDDQSIL